MMPRSKAMLTHTKRYTWALHEFCNCTTYSCLCIHVTRRHMIPKYGFTCCQHRYCSSVFPLFHRFVLFVILQWLSLYYSYCTYATIFFKHMGTLVSSVNHEMKSHLKKTGLVGIISMYVVVLVCGDSPCLSSAPLLPPCRTAALLNCTTSNFTYCQSPNVSTQATS